MVDMERDVPGKSPEKIWQKPIHTACPRLIASIFHVLMLLDDAPGPAASDFALAASTIHITTPPMSRDQPIIGMLSRCLPITLVNRNEGIAVTTNAITTRLSGWFKMVRSPLSPRGNVESSFAIRSRKYTGRQRMAPS